MYVYIFRQQNLLSTFLDKGRINFNNHMIKSIYFMFLKYFKYEHFIFLVSLPLVYFQLFSINE